MADALLLGPTTVAASAGVLRHRTELRFQHDKLPPATVTFELDERWADMVDETSAALVPIALVLAARLGDDLHVDGPLDAEIQRSCRAAIALQSRWFGWRCPALTAPTSERRRQRRRGRGRGLFFTRGIDSWG